MILNKKSSIKSSIKSSRKSSRKSSKKTSIKSSRKTSKKTSRKSSRKNNFINKNINRIELKKIFGGIILAPTCAGKTTYINTHKNDKFNGSTGWLADGDDIITKTVGWSKEKNWWLGKNAKDIHIKQWLAIINTILKHPDLIVLVNGGHYDELNILANKYNIPVITIWLSDDVLTAHTNSRKKSNNFFKPDALVSIASRDDISNAASSFEWKTFNSFDKAIKYFH